MEGRIVMDLFKIVQKDFNLVSYKLDYVAETFINDKITAINGDKLKIKGIEIMNVGHFITINYGFDKKYKDKILNICNAFGVSSWVLGKVLKKDNSKENNFLPEIII